MKSLQLKSFKTKPFTNVIAVFWILWREKKKFSNHTVHALGLPDVTYCTTFSCDLFLAAVSMCRLTRFVSRVLLVEGTETRVRGKKKKSIVESFGYPIQTTWCVHGSQTIVCPFRVVMKVRWNKVKAIPSDALHIHRRKLKLRGTLPWYGHVMSWIRIDSRVWGWLYTSTDSLCCYTVCTVYNRFFFLVTLLLIVYNDWAWIVKYLFKNRKETFLQKGSKKEKKNL